MRVQILCLFILCLSFADALGQPELVLKGDEAITFTWDAYLEKVLSNHPLAKSAGLRPEQAQMLIRKARGYFDPYLYGDYDRKEFSEKNYFSVLDAGLKIPTWYGITVNGGYQNNQGEFLNPMLSLPDQGLMNMGLEVNLGRDLLIDKRRAQLRKAKIYAKANEAERRSMLNGLIVQASEAYWGWALSFAKMEIYEEGVNLSDLRFQGIKSSYEFGDKPAIDTLESYIQRGSRQFSLRESQLKYGKASLELSNFLWNESGQPLEISKNIFPPDLDQLGLSQLRLPDTQTMDSLMAQHPDLLMLQTKAEALGIERRLNREQLKPKLSLKFNLVADPTNAFSESAKGLSPNNFKLGASFAFPLFLRKQRADLSITTLALKETNYKLDQKQWELSNKVKGLILQSETTRKQIVTWSDVADKHQDLLTGEMSRFDAGESSVFIVNSRESKLIKARLQLMDLIVQYPLIRARLYQATGGLDDWLKL